MFKCIRLYIYIANIYETIEKATIGSVTIAEKENKEADEREN